MATHTKNPLICVHPDTKKRLDELGQKGQSYNDIIVGLLGPEKEVRGEFNPEKKICHGTPMRKIELRAGKFAYRCDKCSTLMVKDG